MKENVWAKTTLSVYRYLERICEAIDKLVEKRAMASFYVSSSCFAQNSVMSVANAIINLTERKKTLINLKVLTEKCLENCDEEYAQILIEKYIDGDKFLAIMSRHGYAERTYFRKLSSAESQFTYNMSKLGYSEEKLSSFLAGEKWIIDVYSRFSLMSREDCFELNEARISKLALS